MHAHDPSSYSLDPTNPEDAELIEFFIGELPDRMQTLRSAVETEDIDSIRRLAHQLKGAAPSFGFPEIGSAAAQLEQSILTAQETSLNTIQHELNALFNLCDSFTKGS